MLQHLEIETLLWAQSHGLLKSENSIKQALKMCEEAGEVAGAILKGNKPTIQSEIGDVLVTLAILANQNGLSLESCFADAYSKISKRTGSTVDGVFIKSEDLQSRKPYESAENYEKRCGHDPK